MILRNWRKMLGATAVLLGMTVPILTVSGVNPAHAATSACASVATTDPASLCLESSSDGTTQAPYDTPTIHQGDRIANFKWLVNEDASTGDPAFTAPERRGLSPDHRRRQP